MFLLGDCRSPLSGVEIVLICIAVQACICLRNGNIPLLELGFFLCVRNTRRRLLRLGFSGLGCRINWFGGCISFCLLPGFVSIFDSNSNAKQMDPNICFQFFHGPILKYHQKAVIRLLRDPSGPLRNSFWYSLGF